MHDRSLANPCETAIYRVVAPAHRPPEMTSLRIGLRGRWFSRGA